MNQSAFRQTISLSDHPAPITRSEELEILAKRVCEELPNFSANQLKYIYLKLAEVDVHLTGYISFQEIEHAFRQSKVRTAVIVPLINPLGNLNLLRYGLCIVILCLIYTAIIILIKVN